MPRLKVTPLAVLAGAALLLGTTGCASRHHPAAAVGAASPAAAPSSPAAPTAASPVPTQPAPAGGPVPGGMAATSVTFVSADEAFVLGTAPCNTASCTSIVRTMDRGASWRGLPAPIVPVGRPGSGRGVWGIRFATPAHGFVFGAGLWETTDGGAQWTRVAAPGGSILSLATIDGQLLALTARCSASHGCSQRAVLRRRPLSGGAWARVAAASTTQLTDPTDLIATQAGVAALLDGSDVLVTSDGGVSIARHPTPCGTPGVAYATSVAATTSTDLTLLCTGQAYLSHTVKKIYLSGDGGTRWNRAGSPSAVGDGGTLAAASPGVLTIATSSAASWLYRSADAAASWRTVRTEDDGGFGWADLGFTTPLDGVVVHGPADMDGNTDHHPGQLLLTSNAGASWRLVRF